MTMNETLLKRILRAHRERRRMIALILCLSMIVSMGVFTGLHRNAIAKTYTRQVLDCPYAAEGAERVAHVHSTDCYDENGSLVCTLPEIEPHTHGDACYAETTSLICGMTESEGHQHDESCYTETAVPVCGMEETRGIFMQIPA